MPSKYLPLQEYLQEVEKEGKTKIELTFDKIEENIPEFTLPLAAYMYQSW
jgi:hypothetical protein